MEYNKFPLMGFPGEHNRPDGNVVYQCFFPGARIALWWTQRYTRYELNLYKPLPDDAHRDDTLTDHHDRYNHNQAPISVHDVLEAQLAIFYLTQKYLPAGVTDDICNADQEGRTHAATIQQAAAMHADAAAGEAVE